MTNDFLILGNSATSGSFVTNDSILFSTFGSASNFEVPDFVASASFEISTVNKNITSDATFTVDTFSSSSYNGVIYDYILIDTGVGCRTGQFLTTQDNGNIDYTDTSTKAIGGDSSIPSISAVINGSNINIQVTSGSGYTFKSLVKKL